MSDVYCFLCGANAEVAEQLEIDLAAALDLPRSRVPKAFLFSPEDELFQTSLALCAPHDDLLSPSAPTSTLAQLPASSSTIHLLRACVPGPRHAYAEIRHAPTDRAYWITSNSHIFGHEGCFRILQNVLRRDDWVERFWAVVRKANLAHPAANGISGVDYGEEVDRTQGRTAVLPLGNFDGPDEVRAVVEAGDEAVDEYWVGRGAMWVFSRPDAFPVQEALENTFAPIHLPPRPSRHSRMLSKFEALPVELLCAVAREMDTLPELLDLLRVSKTIRHKLVSSLDLLVRHLIRPHFLPPFALHIGGFDSSDSVSLVEDMLWSRSSSRSTTPDSVLDVRRPFDVDTPATTPTDSVRPPFPWLRYARECARSASMRNRQRIIWICEQIADMVDELTEADIHGAG
ncbi:hypothetical protein EXIGLDRAFT_771100 [Exidia glandulosa HHB12029]|uniref:F-box domain-containing protein n=1 Tax=Exidia glandulosa HHB12029 TaxID=1314781 RepID=A0A165G993_EXIGL|nr:hypothetical protein EXIGLDRAFT_771100 [Exidia glandulosa HHB12029]